MSESISMHTWHQGSIEQGPVRLRYVRSGGELPPLVLVHGFTDSALYFTRLAEMLALRWDVVAYDARGHGLSTRLKESGGTFDDETRVNDLVQVIEQLELARPVLIGHSMGAATIGLAIAAHPTISRAAVLEDPAWWEPTDAQISADEDARSARIDAWRTWVTAIQEMSWEDALALRRGEEPQWSPIDLETSLQARRQFDLDLFRPFLPLRSEWRSVVKRLTIPTLLMIGTEISRGRIITTELAEEAADLSSMLSWVAIEGAGHHLRYDRFDDYSARVNQFLSEV
jgi:N-formylmaleamate deformylase